MASTQSCSVLDLANASAVLAHFMTQASHEHHKLRQLEWQRDRIDRRGEQAVESGSEGDSSDYDDGSNEVLPMLDYGLAGLPAVGLWVVELQASGKTHELAMSAEVSTAHLKIPVVPIAPARRKISKGECEQLVRADEEGAERLAEGRHSEGAFHFDRVFQVDAPGRFSVRLWPILVPRAASNSSKVARCEHWYKGMPVLTAPYLLVRGVVAISDAHDKRQQQWDNPRVVAACNDVFAWELLGLVLLSQLCEAHAEDRPDFLGTEDAWLAWIARAENRDTYRHARHAFARTLQADVGVLQQVRLTLSHPLEVDKALLWLTERFKRDIPAHQAGHHPPASSHSLSHLTHYATGGRASSLGQASSRYFPQDRRFASARGF